MKVIVAGSRGIVDLYVVAKAIKQSKFKVTTLVSGCARGVDSLGEEWAKRNNVRVRRFPAEWDRLGRSAGYVRNCEMAEYADALVAIWDGKSPGTKHMIDIAEREELRVFVLTVPPQ